MSAPDPHVVEVALKLQAGSVLAREVLRLRARTHEIQAQEMAKRADLDREVAEWRQRYATAREWTEIEGLTAEWAEQRPSGYHPFWSMTSYNMRSTLLRLVTERDEALAEVERLRAESPRNAALTRVDLRCDQCGRSTADSYGDMAAPVVYFVRQGLCHPCSRSTQASQ